MVPTPRGEKYQVVRLYFIQQSESGKAWQFVMGATKQAAGSSYVWLPVSMIWRKKEHTVAPLEDYPRWDVTIPQFLVAQKNLTPFILP